jgi:CDP-glucose 4,6-dehydratase
MSARTALVTGAYGVLGLWLVRALLERGDRVVVVRRDVVPVSGLGLEGLESEIAVVAGDVLEEGLVLRALADYEVDTVFHLAAQTLVGTARSAPGPTFEVNVRGTWTVLEACRQLDVPRTVVASSDKAYGPAERLPYREEDPLLARFPYDASKAAADVIARSYWWTYGVPVAVTRFANLYGGGDLNRSRLVPESVAAALAGRPPVIRSDGTPQRDWLYAQDAAAAYMAIADALDCEGDGARGEAFNAGGGRPYAVREVVELVCRAAGANVEPDIRGSGTPSGEIERQYVDTTKIRERLGWEARVGLEEGIERTVDWYRRHPRALS